METKHHCRSHSVTFSRKCLSMDGFPECCCYMRINSDLLLLVLTMYLDASASCNIRFLSSLSLHVPKCLMPAIDYNTQMEKYTLMEYKRGGLMYVCHGNR